VVTDNAIALVLLDADGAQTTLTWVENVGRDGTSMGDDPGEQPLGRTAGQWTLVLRQGFLSLICEGMMRFLSSEGENKYGIQEHNTKDFSSKSPSSKVSLEKNRT